MSKSRVAQEAAEYEAADPDGDWEVMAEVPDMLPRDPVAYVKPQPPPPPPPPLPLDDDLASILATLDAELKDPEAKWCEEDETEAATLRDLAAYLRGAAKKVVAGDLYPIVAAVAKLACRNGQETASEMERSRVPRAEECLEILKTAAETRPQKFASSASFNFAEGVALKAMEKWEDAATSLRMAAIDDPNERGPWFALGYVRGAATPRPVHDDAEKRVARDAYNRAINKPEGWRVEKLNWYHTGFDAGKDRYRPVFYETLIHGEKGLPYRYRHQSNEDDGDF